MGFSEPPLPHPHEEQFLWPERACYKGREAKINVKLSFASSFLQHTFCINYTARGKRKARQREVSVCCLG